MATWTLIDGDYPREDGTETVDIDYTAGIVARIDYFISNNTSPRLIICEGDSWFHYSRFFGYSNMLLPIKDELEAKDKSPDNISWGLVNLGNSGDTLAEMASDRHADLLKSILKQYKNNTKTMLNVFYSQQAAMILLIIFVIKSY